MLSPIFQWQINAVGVALHAATVLKRTARGVDGREWTLYMVSP